MVFGTVVQPPETQYMPGAQGMPSVAGRSSFTQTGTPVEHSK
jgi:hypothetical protein